MKLENTTDQIMVMCAQRYCMGRHSYAVGACQEFLRNTWDQVESSGQGVIVRDTIEFLMDQYDNAEIYNRPYKEDSDTESWRMFAIWAYDKLSNEGRAWLYGNLLWRTKKHAWNYCTMDREKEGSCGDDGENCEHGCTDEFGDTECQCGQSRCTDCQALSLDEDPGNSHS